MFHDRSNNFQFDRTQLRTQSHFIFWTSTFTIGKTCTELLLIHESQHCTSTPRSFAISKFVPSPCLSFVFPLQDRIRVVLCVGCLHCCCHYSRKCHGCIPFNRRWTSSRSHDFDRTLSFLKIDPNPLYCILRAVFMNCGPLV